MAMAEEDQRLQELNSIFKSLGERGKEGELWKSFIENVLIDILQQLSENLSKNFENCIILRPYGSAVEDLKCLAPDNVGDLDIMIIPKSDDLMIYDELIEYLPQHPAHVRIKGVDHPVLKSCLVGDTEFVATSAIKTFHPAVYGPSAPNMLDYLTRSLQIVREKWGEITWENKEACPALQINYKQSFGSISEEVEKLKNPETLTYLDPAEWEWYARNLRTASGGEYTKEHAEILDEYFKFANELQTSMFEKGLICQPQAFRILVQELVCSDRVKQLRARVLDIESRPQNESERGERGEDLLPEAAEHNNKQCVTPENCHDNESGSEKEKVSQAQETLPPSDGSSLMPEDADDNPRSAEDLPQPTSSQSTKEDSSEKQHQSSEDPMSKEVTEIKEDMDNKRQRNGNNDPNDRQNESIYTAEQQPLAEKGDLSHKDFESLSGGSHLKLLFDHLFGPVLEESKATSQGTYEKHTDKTPIKGGFDLVPALRCPGWPQVSRDWIKLERKWPSPDVVNKVVQEGFHLVVKPPKNGGNPDCDFRISFSHAEYLLSQEMNDIQRECYRCLKRFHRAYLSKDPKGLVTFHLKNLLLQTIEETGAEMWTELNRAECMMKLLGNLVEALRKKDLRHFFVRSYNLFCVDYIDSPEILNSLAEKAANIMENPMQFAMELSQNEESANEAQVKQDKRIPSSEPATKTASGHEHGEMEETQRNNSQNVLRGAVRNESSHLESSSSTSSYRFHDLKDIYLATSRELTDMAFNDTEHPLEALDPLEKPLVKDLRKMITNHNIQDAEFRMMFEVFWNIIYLKVWMNREPNLRLRMLDAIQGVVETLKYLLRQDDFALENVEALADRLVHPDTEDRFDLTHLLPAGIGTQVISRFTNSFERRSAQIQEVNLMDDMPLD